MDRRDFIRMAGCAGLAVFSPLARPGSAQAAGSDEPYNGPFYAMVNAIGGWDTTYLCDPKGVNGINQGYRAGEIRQVASSPIQYAPIGNNQYFFEKYGRELLVLNGVDMATTGHFPGSRYAWTGNLESSEYPTFAALVAAAKSPELALAHLSYGGYDSTGNLIPLARISRVQHLNVLMSPDHRNGDAQDPFYPRATIDRIRQAAAERHADHADHEHLPSRREAMSSLFTSKLGALELNRLKEYLPSSFPTDNPMKAQALIAAAAFKAGICVSVNMVFGGFDSHARNDAEQYAKLPKVLEGIDVLMERAGELGIRDKVVVVAASDFGRTPRYNSGNGKDHWSIGSVMIMGQGVRGNRVIGATDEEQRAFTINANTLQLEHNGIKIRPEHIHRALRTHAGIIDHPISRRFELDGEDLNLLG